MLVSDNIMHQLIQIINSYHNGNKMKVIAKINSLIMFNICTFGAGTQTDKPLFNLTNDHTISREQRDLEVSIMFLLRNINDLHCTLAEPIYGHPLETLLLDEEPEVEAEATVTAAEENKTEAKVEKQETEEKGEELFTMSEKIGFLIALFIVLCASAYLISKSAALNIVK